MAVANEFISLFDTIRIEWNHKVDGHYQNDGDTNRPVWGFGKARFSTTHTGHVITPPNRAGQDFHMKQMRFWILGGVRTRGNAIRVASNLALGFHLGVVGIFFSNLCVAV